MNLTRINVNSLQLTSISFLLATNISQRVGWQSHAVAGIRSTNETFKCWIFQRHSKVCRVIHSHVRFSTRRSGRWQERAWVPICTATKQINMAEFPELGKHCDVQTCKQLGKSQLCGFVFFCHYHNVLVTLPANASSYLLN